MTSSPEGRQEAAVLDAKALRSAILVGSAECREYGIPEPHDGIYEAAIHAYLSALPGPVAAVLAEARASPSYSGIDPEQVETVFNVLWPQQEWNGEEGFCRAVAEKVLRTLLLPEVRWGDSGPIPGQDFGDEFGRIPAKPAVEVVEALRAAVRAAKLALFVIRKQGIMPNSSWESGFNSDVAKAETALAALQAPATPDAQTEVEK